MPNISLTQWWNEDHKSHTIDREASYFAVETEKLFPKNSLVCDLGGGRGSDTIYFLSKGYKVHLLDISEYALQTAKKKAVSVGYTDKLLIRQIDLSGGEISETDNFFDIVYSRLALHYFLAKETKQLFKEIIRILKPGGVGYITFKSPEDQNEMDYLKTTAKETEPGVFIDEKNMIKSRFSINQLEELLRGLDIKNYTIKLYKEELEARDKTKSGNKQLLMNEVVIKK